MLIVIGLFGLLSSTVHAKDYAPVFKLFDQCVLMKLNNGDVLLHEECGKLFDTIYTTNTGQSIAEFNERWVRNGGEKALTTEPSKYIYNITEESCRSCSLIKYGNNPTNSLSQECKACEEIGFSIQLRNFEANLRENIVEALEPNFIGLRNYSYVEKELIKSVKSEATFGLRLVYSQLSACFSRNHTNARLLREIASKVQYIKHGKATFTPKHLFQMYRVNMFSSMDKEMCFALDKVVENSKPEMIEILKGYIENTSIEKQECLPIKTLLQDYKKFTSSAYPENCKQLYISNMDRILPIAVGVLNSIEEQEQEKQNITSEQIIK